MAFLRGQFRLWPLLIWLAAGTLAGAQTSREYQIKAAFLFNFAQFTEWPTNAFASPDEPIIIGILGVDPFGRFIDETVKNEVVKGRQLVVERYRRVEEIKKCHILFISQSEAGRLDQILAGVKGKPILTVSDIEGAAYRGTMIRFITERNKVRLRINLEAVKSAEMSLSAKVLQAAEIVGQEKR